MTEEPRKDSQATRRGVLAGVGLAGLAGAITACGASGSSSSAAAGGTPSSGATTASVPTASSSGSASSSSGGASSALASTSAIPVGGGKIFPTQLAVVTQPTAGEFKVFSAVCTHMGCVVGTVANGRIDCPCHGSEYSITTGAVLAGPAPKPLPAKSFKVSGGSIFLE